MNCRLPAFARLISGSIKSLSACSVVKETKAIYDHNLIERVYARSSVTNREMEHRLLMIAGVDELRLKREVVAYWNADPRNWPVKVISSAQATKLGARPGVAVGVSGCVGSEKFVRGRTLDEAEKILGFNPGELRQGAALLRLVRLPVEAEFALVPSGGYTNVPAYPGYPPGLGSNQWILNNRIFATVKSVAKPGQTLSF